MRKLFGIIVLAAPLLIAIFPQPGKLAVRESEAGPRDTNPEAHRFDVAPRQEPDEDDDSVNIGSTWALIGLCGVVLLVIVIGAAMLRGLPTLGPTRRRISTRDYVPPPGEGEPRSGVIEPPPAPDLIHRSRLEGQSLPEDRDQEPLDEQD